MYVRSFAELERDKKVTAAQIRETLEDYAATRSGINSRVVISLLKKVHLSSADRDALVESAKKGMEQQKGHPGDRLEYEKVFHHLEWY